MTNVFTAGNLWLVGKLKSYAGESVTYTRGVESVSLTITRGQTAFETEDTDGFTITAHSIDFIVKASDLVLDGEVALPEVRDYITDAAGKVYSVLILPGGTHYRFSDPAQTILRVHTRMVDDGQ